jgi:hypothetical protein
MTSGNFPRLTEKNLTIESRDAVQASGDCELMKHSEAGRSKFPLPDRPPGLQSLLW